MWKWLEAIGEFAVTNWRVVRDAWGAFLVWCAIAAVALWWVQGKIVELQIINLQSEKSTLTTRVTVLEGQNRDLASQLASAKAPASTPEPLKKTERDPDGIYQFGAQVGSVQFPQVNESSGIVVFAAITGAPKLNANREFEYRNMVLKIREFHRDSQSNLGGRVDRALGDVTCEIVGRISH